MADTYKVLGQALTGELALDGSTVKETLLYTVPANTQASVSAIEVTSSDVANQTYKVAFVPSAEVDTAVSSVEYTAPVNRFVAVAYGSNIAAYSTDGISWIETTMPSSAYWNAVTSGGGTFVAVPYLSSTAAYSTDGITWTASTIPYFEWSSVTYGGGKFVAVAYDSNTGAYSTDGITWIETTMPSSMSNFTDWNSVTYGGGKFVAIAASSSTAAYSTDGITWTASSMPSSTYWYSVTYSGLAILSQSVLQSLNKHIAIYNKTIASGETHEIKGGVTLSAGDQIRVYSNSSNIITNVYGVEIA